MLQDITNYFQMTDEVATSGQPSEVQFSEIAAAGYKVVINLAMPDDEHAIRDEGAIVSGLGMTYIHIPVPFEAPGLDHLNQFLAVMQAAAPAKTWVHCVVNARVSAFNYHYLKHCLGLAEVDCWSPLLVKWQPKMAPVWSDFLKISAEEINL